MDKMDLQWWFLTVLLPFLYGNASRLPFIPYAIEAFKFGFDPFQMGCLIASYQACRALSNWLQGRLPQWEWTLVAYSLATLGYAANLHYATRSQGKIQFIIGFMIAGFSEVLPALSTWLKHYSADSSIEVQRRWYRVQYSTVNFAAAFSFGVGGILYGTLGVHAIAVHGGIASCLGLAATAAYGVLFPSARHGWSVEVAKTQDTDTELGATPAETKARQADEGRTTQHVEADMGAIPADSQLGNRHITFVDYVMGLCFGIESTTIATVLSVGPLFLYREYGLQPIQFGALMAAGELVGFVFMLAIVKKEFHDAWRRCIPNPWPLCCAFGLLVLENLMYLAPKQNGGVVWACVGQVLIHGVNGFAVGILIEMQGGVIAETNMKFITSFSQTARRTANTCFSLISPVLYFKVAAVAPFFLAAIISFAWLIFIAIVFALDMRAKNADLRAPPHKSPELPDLPISPHSQKSQASQVSTMSWVTLTLAWRAAVRK